jgi:hypothetical protein
MGASSSSSSTSSSSSDDDDKRRDSAVSHAGREQTAAAPIAIIDFGGMASSRAANLEIQSPGAMMPRDENVTTPASAPSMTGTEEHTNRSYWKRVKGKAFWQSPRSLWQVLT